MPTVRTVTVKASGGDYTSVADALAGENALHADLVTADIELHIQLWIRDTVTIHNPPDFICDGSHIIHIEAAPGMEAKSHFDPATQAGFDITNDSVFYFNLGSAGNTGKGWYDINSLAIRIINTSGSGPYYFAKLGSMTGVSTNSLQFRSFGCYFFHDNQGGTALCYGTQQPSGAFKVRYYNSIFDSFDYGYSIETAVNLQLNNITYVNCTTFAVRATTTSTSNVTIINTGAALKAGGSDFHFTGSVNAASTNNSSTDGTAPGSNPITGTPTFVDAANGNYALDISDTLWKDAGASNGMTTDINDNPRTDGFIDVGASEATAGGGGTTVTQNVSGSITPTGSLNRQIGENLGGSITPSGSLSSLLNPFSIHPTGAITPIGDLPFIGVGFDNQFQGSITPVGSFTIALDIIIQELDGEIVPFGDIGLQPGTILVGSITPVGGLALPSKFQSISGGITPTSSLVKGLFMYAGGNSSNIPIRILRLH